MAREDQHTLEGNLAGYDVLDMTAGFFGMQWEVKEYAGVNLDASRYRPGITVLGDFTNLPFRDSIFWKLLFDPPHTVDKRNTLLGTLEPNDGLGPHLGSFKYGAYHNIDQLRKGVYRGALEAYRVLKPGGTLIFKWSDSEKAYSWATDTVEKAAPKFEKFRVRLKKSGANTGNYSFYAYYRKAEQ